MKYIKDHINKPNYIVYRRIITYSYTVQVKCVSILLLYIRIFVSLIGHKENSTSPSICFGQK